MEVNMSTKISFYDFLTMYITGLLLTPFFWEVPFCKNMFLISVIAFIIGLCFHRLLDIVSSFFGKRKGFSLFFGTVFVRNYDKAIEEARSEVQNDGTNDKDNSNKTNEDYYQAYYDIMKEPCYKVVSILEAQVAFFRNLMWVAVIYLLVNCHRDCDNLICVFNFCESWRFSECNRLLSVLLIFLALLCRFFTQKKIYYLVWEGKKYLNLNNVKNDGNETLTN